MNRHGNDDELLSCPICGNNSQTIIPNLRSHFIVICKSCDFVFSNKIPKKSELDNVYRNYDYESSISTAATLTKKAEIAEKLVSFKSIGKPVKVLDVGCGNGEWLDAFKARGCQTYGTEYDDQKIKMVESKGHVMLEGGLFPSSHDGKTFDIIIFTELIEHIQNPIAVLANLNTLLAVGGHIFITTPNYSSIERMMLGSKWGMICYPEHLTYFTPKTLDLTLKKTGFSKVAIYTENISIFRILQAIGAKKNTQQIVSNNIQALTTESIVFSWGKVVINKFLNFFGLGASVVALYKKS